MRSSQIPFEVSLDSLELSKAMNMEEETPDLNQELIVATAIPLVSNVTELLCNCASSSLEVLVFTVF